MFKKILIANRGEIACRVMKTARRMGIGTVAVYSDADKEALHVEMADEAYRVGPPPVVESYLNIDAIVQACRDSGAEAVHPGYGFLSENTAFAERLQSEGIVFVGPSAHAIRSMGDKIASKKLADEAGVNTIPGYTGVVEGPEHAVQIAADIGYPVMIKASAGGGGKGMRIAHNEGECRDGFERATNEAETAFGDGRVFLERYITTPRHIEIQVLADGHGNTVYLFERECSLQRRHQKVIEESPSPLLDQATREAMGSQAVALAKAVDYQSAGTVEFVVDADKNFFFLEMNTRLQVEHPVTEFVTGVDLVELMLRVAAGEALPFKQADLKQTGWAIESRVYAEDPMRGFLPSVGRLVRFSPPPESVSVRVDTGVGEGDEISIYYDPMIAKLITYGPNRERAIAEMRKALNRFYISGLSHNISFLAALVEHPRFRDGRMTTTLIGEQYPDGFQPDEEVHDEPKLLIAVAATVHRRYMERAARISHQVPGYERRVPQDWVVMMGGEQHSVSVSRAESGRGYRVTYAGEPIMVVTDWQFGQPQFEGTINGEEVSLIIERHNLVYRLLHWGAQVDVMVLTARAAELLAKMPVKEPPDMSRFLVSPMPGLLAELRVAVGDEVKSGQEVAVVEAMKMENVLRVERDGRVSQALAGVGDTLAADQPILELDTDA